MERLGKVQKIEDLKKIMAFSASIKLDPPTKQDLKERF